VPTSTIPPFLQARCPSCRPTNNVKALKALNVPQQVQYKLCALPVGSICSNCITSVQCSAVGPSLWLFRWSATHYHTVFM